MTPDQPRPNYALVAVGAVAAAGVVAAFLLALRQAGRARRVVR